MFVYPQIKLFRLYEAYKIKVFTKLITEPIILPVPAVKYDAQYFIQGSVAVGTIPYIEHQ